MEVIFFIVCFGASVIGAICGIGGGVIIKPVLDSLGIMDVSAVSFLSGCTVLSMSACSVLKSITSGESQIRKGTGFPLAIGAAVGGLAGKELFTAVRELSSVPEKVGAVQAVCLLIVTAGTLIYTLTRDKIITRSIENIRICILIGLILGIMSSFLGIGGGPVNLVLLYYFFSMSTKEAAENSLYIIFVSQLASLIAYFVTGTVPTISLHILILMASGGIMGGVLGRKWNSRMKESTVERLFIGLMILLLLINVYNIFKFLQKGMLRCQLVYY